MKTVPLGKPLELSDSDLDRLTTADEIKRLAIEADAFWKKNVKPRKFQALPNAILLDITEEDL